MASYTVTQRVYFFDTFESEDIPEGMTPAEFAEQRYSDDGIGVLDGHTLLIFEDSTIIFDGEDGTHEEDDERQVGVVPEVSEDDILHDVLMTEFFKVEDGNGVTR